MDDRHDRGGLTTSKDSTKPCILRAGKVDGKDQETIQSSTTPDPGYHMGK